MPELSERQIQILKLIIEEYIDTAEPVGSAVLDKKYNLGISPATIRNEMVKLTSMGYLKQPHTSAGRTPTPAALRYYIDHLMESKPLSVTEEVLVKEKIWDFRHELDKLLREATRALAQRTKTLAVTATDEGTLYYAGAANILDMAEFYDIDLTKAILSLLDQANYWEKLIEQTTVSKQQPCIILGAESGESLFEPFGGVFSGFNLPQNHQATIGVVGPTRLNYPMVVPIVGYLGQLLNSVVGKW